MISHDEIRRRLEDLRGTLDQERRLLSGHMIPGATPDDAWYRGVIDGLERAEKALVHDEPTWMLCQNSQENGPMLLARDQALAAVGAVTDEKLVFYLDFRQGDVGEEWELVERWRVAGDRDFLPAPTWHCLLLAGMMLPGPGISFTREAREPLDLAENSTILPSHATRSVHGLPWSSPTLMHGTLVYWKGDENLRQIKARLKKCLQKKLDIQEPFTHARHPHGVLTRLDPSLRVLGAWDPTLLRAYVGRHGLVTPP